MGVETSLHLWPSTLVGESFFLFLWARGKLIRFRSYSHLEALSVMLFNLGICKTGATICLNTSTVLANNRTSIDVHDLILHVFQQTKVCFKHRTCEAIHHVLRYEFITLTLLGRETLHSVQDYKTSRTDPACWKIWRHATSPQSHRSGAMLVFHRCGDRVFWHSTWILYRGSSVNTQLLWIQLPWL